MRRWIWILCYTVLFLQFVNEKRIEHIFEESINKHPGLHLTGTQSGTHQYISSMMYAYLNDSNVSVTVIEDVPLSYGVAGVTHYIDDKTFVILMRWKISNDQSDFTLLHEWGHVIQMHEKMLVEYNNGVWFWKGELVDFSIPWAQRPWEISADSIANYHQTRVLPWRDLKPLR